MSSAVNGALNDNPELVRGMPNPEAVPIRAGRSRLSCSAVALRARRSQTLRAHAPQRSRQLVARLLNVLSFITPIDLHRQIGVSVLKSRRGRALCAFCEGN